MASSPILARQTGVHAQIIDRICAEWPGAQRSGFARAIHQLDDELGPVPFVPDAFSIDRTALVVRIFEAVHTSDITDAKFRQITRLACDLDTLDWCTVLVRCDIYGTTAWHVFNTMVRAIHAGRYRDGLPIDWRHMPKTDARASEAPLDLVGGCAVAVGMESGR